jgi:hypothetical protein
MRLSRRPKARERDGICDLLPLGQLLARTAITRIRLPMTRATRAAPLALGLAILTACGRGDSRRGFFANATPDTVPLVLGAGDVLITNTDSSMDLALVGDHLVLQFGEKVQHKLHEQLDTSKVDSSRSRFGAMIERAVKRGVGNLVNRRIEQPLTAIRSIDYRDGRIDIAYQSKPTFSFENMKVDGNRPVLESFPPDDAKRLVAAVQARLAESTPK